MAATANAKKLGQNKNRLQRLDLNLEKNRFL